VLSFAYLRAPDILLQSQLDLSQGRMTKTSNPLDVAISGAGMFRLAGTDGSIVYSRSGQFRLAEDGRVVNAQGYALQTADTGDLVLTNGSIEVQADGTVLDADHPVARIAIYKPVQGADVRPFGGSIFTISDGGVEEVAAPELRQGMVEASNVALADEMVTMMDAARQAEGGARMVQVYDDLMGKAVSAFGQGAR
jgi:flagellar basal-body rod protein FlgG